MLKRRRRFAQARLPTVTAPADSAAGHVGQQQAAADWPAVLQTPGKALWLSISFITLPNELKRFLSSESWRNTLAQWALSYTPVVSIDPEGALLLEIGGSLRLFGGLQALRRNLQSALRDKRVNAVLACAPTARAAVWLARTGLSLACIDQATAATRLGAVPVAALGWPARVQQKLQQMGVHTLADCRRLPRDGFARRIGRVYLHSMDEAFGARAHSPVRYTEPLHFHERLELTGETLDSAVLLASIDVLLQQLQAFLRRHQATVQAVVLQFEHLGHAASLCTVSGGAASTQTGHLLELAGLRIERTVLPEPVTAVVLEAQTQPGSVYVTGELPGMPAATSADPAHRAQLLARLQARLGQSRVHGLGLVAEYRPEKAWHVVDAPTAQKPLLSSGRRPLSPTGRRPLWLLREPRRIARPDVETSLRDAERIESGWWDGHDVRRDYYRIDGPAGSRWWVYRDCRDQYWYLHGLFG